MKTRNGFVSNSSSSSFILNSPSIISSKDDLKKFFKPFEFEYFSGYDNDIKTHIITPDMSSEYAFDNLQLFNWDNINHLYYFFPFIFDDKFQKKIFDSLINKKIIDLEEYTKFKNKFDVLQDKISNLYNFFDDDYDEELYDKKIDELYKQQDELLDIYFDNFDKLVDDEIIHSLSNEINNLKLKYPHLYILYAEGSGNGWISPECNGIYETSPLKVFKEEYLVYPNIK